MKTSHTPGKWSLTTTRNKEVRLFTDMAGGMYLGTLDLAGNDDIKQANAQLIASAPELLEALQYVVKWHSDNDSGEGELFGRDYITTVIGAIRKATEGQ